MSFRTQLRAIAEGWRGVGLVFIVYVYFLIFAQFGFLQRMSGLGWEGNWLKLVMAAMAVGGIGSSLSVARVEGRWSASARLRWGLAGCTLGAGLTWLPLNLPGAVAVSLLVGASLGLTTVTLVAHLDRLMGGEHPLAKKGVGVGLAYFVCNWPVLFEGTPSTMAATSAALCLIGVGLVPSLGTSAPFQEARSPRNFHQPAWLVIGCFMALVWLDSAAFYIIQNTPSLKSLTWEGARRLWQNGGIHLLAAVGSGMLLERKGLSQTLGLAFAALASACLLLAVRGGGGVASVLYPLGVSLYSVALVAYPAFLAGQTTCIDKARLGGRLYAVAGWLGSGLGIGMAEHLRRIPLPFVMAAALLFGAPLLPRFWRENRRKVAVLLTLLLLAWGHGQLAGGATHSLAAGDPLTAEERGRLVYIHEGCIHCHSQYVRPETRDETMWGPSAELADRRKELPPLIGNRRQGPDLTEVGTRRSPLWLKAHFMDPRSVSPGSIMPSYAHLFEDERGMDLVAYLQSLGRDDILAHYQVAQRSWKVTEAMQAAAAKVDGAALLQARCASCHSSDGTARQRWQSEFKRLPPDFALGPYFYAPKGLNRSWRLNRLAEIIKFGVPGTDMAGHEYERDEEVVAMAREILRLSETSAHEGIAGGR